MNDFKHDGVSTKKPAPQGVVSFDLHTHNRVPLPLLLSQSFYNSPIGTHEEGQTAYIYIHQTQLAVTAG